VLSLTSTIHRATRCMIAVLATCSFATATLADFKAGYRYAQQGDYAAARREYLEAAQDGNARAQNNLANLFRFGLGGPVDFERALYWFSKAAGQGQVNAQTSLGDMYETGDGVARDYLRAAYWYRRAAVAGFFIGQYSLGEMFEVGRGVPRDPIAAMAWYTIAAKAKVDPKNKFYSESLSKALEARSTLEHHMTTADRVAAEDIAEHWIVGFDLPPRPTAENPGARGSGSAPPRSQNTARAAPKKQEARLGTGTGFIINGRGDVVTNNHVAGQCSRLSFGLNGGPLVDGRLVAVDPENDLAVVNFPLHDAPAAMIANGARESLGEEVSVFGYPLLGILSTGGNLTRGSISALSGVADDVRYMQISAPIQPGNSGGPVLDGGGRVIGVVTYKLDALTAIKASGDVPQNVNFALKIGVLRLFLDSHSIPYGVADAAAANPPTSELGETIQKFTGVVACYK
jgi:S1-C subfamily serine protease